MQPTETAPRPDFETALAAWLVKAQALTSHPNFGSRSAVLCREDGRRYVKIVRVDGSSRCAHAFVDKTNGDVLKPASWKGPAKHARGNIYSGEVGVGAFGAHYLVA